MRIVSLLPSATEIVFALGLGDQLEGVTYECDHPPEARSKPVVSESALPQDRPLRPGEIETMVAEFMQRKEPLYQLDKDLLRKIQPDLILTQDLCRVCAVPTGLVQDALDELGLGTSSRVLSLDPHSLEDILASVLAVGRATGTEDRAGEVVEGLRQRIERVRRTALRLPSIRTLCVEWIEPPRVAGHWVPEMVDAAAGINLLNGPGEPSRTCTWRQAADANPEVVVLMPCGYYLEEAEEQAASLFALPDFAGMPAARGKAVFAVDATSYFSRPGPRIVDGLEILAWAIHPEAFPHPGSDRVTRLG